MTAPRPQVLLLTLLLLCGTATAHFIVDCPFLAARVSPALPAAGACLFALTLAALLRTALSDPGVLPRATPPEAAAVASTDAQRPPPRARDVLVNGTPVKLKYCFTCKMFRPPRASHCSLCDNCVDRFDHHCPWVGNCVGRRNYRYFYTFVVSLAFLAVFVFACAVTHLALLARGAAGGAGGAAGLGEALRQSPGSAVVAGVCFLSVWSVLGLAGFHTYLAATDQTTNEDIKGAFSGRRGAGVNPYSRGSACANCRHVLCGPLPPSLIARRRPVGSDLPLQFIAALTPVAVPPVTVQPPLYRDGEALGMKPLPSAPAPAPASPAHAHAYMNHSLDLDPLPPPVPVAHTAAAAPNHAAPMAANTHAIALQELRLSAPQMDRLDSAVAGVGVGVGLGGASLSASRLRLLHDTTMIDAALDLDEPTLL